MSVADDSGVWECLALEHNSMHQLNIAGVAVRAAHYIGIRMSFIGQVCLHIRGICYSDRSSTVQQNDNIQIGNVQNDKTRQTDLTFIP